MSDCEKKNTIIGAGEILWDMLPAGKQIGGAPANFAYHTQALGAEGVIVSSLGADDLGREILEQLDKLGLDTQFISTDPSLPTGTVSIEVDQHGKPTYIIHENVAWDHISVNNDTINCVADADGICFGSLSQRSQISRDSIRQLLQATKTDCIRVFDVNLRQDYFTKQIIHDSLELANILKVSDEELPVIAEMFSLDAMESQILAQLADKYNLGLIALTKGSYGSCLFTPDEVSIHKGFPTEIADTVGAGDAFTAALILGLLKAEPLDKINENANRLASFVCSQHGAMPPLPKDLLTI